MAQAQLGLSYSANGETERSAESTTKAWRLRDRVSEREKFFIDFCYDRQVTGNLERPTRPSSCGFRRIPARNSQIPMVC